MEIKELQRIKLADETCWKMLTNIRKERGAII